MKKTKRRKIKIYQQQLSIFQGRSPAEPRFTARRGQSREREDATVHAQYTSRNQFVDSY